MPKLKPSPVAAAADIVQRNIESRCAYFKLKTDKEISEKLQMPKSTYADRRNNPRAWTLEQIVMVSISLKCTPQWLFTDHSEEFKEVQQ